MNEYFLSNLYFFNKFSTVLDLYFTKNIKFKNVRKKRKQNLISNINFFS